MGEKTHTPLRVEQVFETRYFEVVPELIGAIHVFTYNGHRISIALPSIGQVRRKNEEYCSATWGSWKSIDGHDVPCEYVINVVTVRVDVADRILLPPEILKRHPNAYDLFSDEEVDAIERICERYEEIATEAFQYWIGIMRWTSDYFKLGREIVTHSELHRSPQLYSVDMNKKVWSKSVMMRVRGVPRMQQAVWEKANQALLGNVTPPTYVGLLHDAEEYLERREFRRSMLDIAVACEVYLRSQVLASLPAWLAPSLVKAIEDLNINQYVQNHLIQILSPTQSELFKSLRKDLSSLFAARNDIMHMAKTSRATEGECKRFIQLARTLFDIRDV